MCRYFLKEREGRGTYILFLLMCPWKVRMCSVKQLRCLCHGKLTCLGPSLAFCLRGKSSCCNAVDRNTQDCGTMRCLVGHAYCCNRDTSSAHATTCKKFAYRLNKPGKLNTHDEDNLWCRVWWCEHLAYAWSLRLAAGLCFCPGYCAGRALRGSQWSCQEWF